MTSLEGHYRRLLRWYPRHHRAVHEEEMLAVLMADAVPSQRRPGMADVVDLVRGGLRVRWNHAVGAPSAPHWRQAVNVAAILGPLMLITIETARVASGVVYAMTWRWDPMGLSALWWNLGRSLVFAIPYALIAALALSGMGRKAAAGFAWTWAVLYVWLVASPESDVGPVPRAPRVAPFYIDAGAVELLVFVLTSPPTWIAILVTLAPSPASARLRPAVVASWMAAGVATLVLSNLDWPVVDDLAMHIILTLAFLLAAAGAAPRSGTGRRTALILFALLLFAGNLMQALMALIAMLFAAVVIRAAGRA
ncbi:hypothetical protein SAMN05421505_109159 [Sinosporangium album]|uniref:Uncharacterized protein n=1 Tax=Sinosporangium album TaxID=504805 RepID=A0A1G7Y9S4_9ACTN|nr:hypothetical protein [Sinosporangium album]SDG93175.1 hypothetical protein SAMN05421505_109159 [Sinosporangium album]